MGHESRNDSFFAAAAATTCFSRCQIERPTTVSEQHGVFNNVVDVVHKTHAMSHELSHGIVSIISAGKERFLIECGLKGLNHTIRNEGKYCYHMWKANYQQTHLCVNSLIYKFEILNHPLVSPGIPIHQP